MKRLDLHKKIGQLFVVPVRDDVMRHVRENHVGGVIWFESTTPHVRKLTAELQAAAGTPLLVSADLESGLGMRFTDATWWPPAMALAATGDVALAEEQARISAIEARAIGVNHILAPVADVNVDPQNPVINTRSFGEDPRDVARFTAAYVRGIESGGCLSTAKHFPGHGDTHVDSHRALPVLEVDRARLDSVELVPFRAAIEAGVSSVMMGHLAVPALDDTPAPVRAEFENVYGTTRGEVTRGGTLPATVSARMIELLRRDLGFQGLVITDSFDMGGLAAHFDAGEAAVRAIEAGEDQILFSTDTDAAIAAVLHAVRSGRIREERIDESVERILRAKRALECRGSDAAFESGSELPHSIAQRSITLVRDSSGLLPLQSKASFVVVTDLAEGNPLTEFPEARVINSETAEASIDTEILVLLLAVRAKSGLGRIHIPPAAKRLAEKHASRTIAVSFGSPYLLRELGGVSTYICAYGIQPVLQRAAMRAIRGQAPMTGTLPVTI
jgi:beta-N-acetylhexosaminidase